LATVSGQINSCPIRANARKMPPRQTREASLAEAYDVTIVTVRPGTHPQALAVLGKSVADDRKLLACWYSDIGAVKSDPDHPQNPPMPPQRSIPASSRSTRPIPWA